jgi:chlorobactene glucosyltransferase
MSALVPLLWTLPWIGPAIITLIRSRHSCSLDDFSPDVGVDAPLVSVIIPARNERRNIERCVRSVLSSRYPHLEVIVVDDHSTDGTGDAAGAIGQSDTRLRVVQADDLPQGWFGKQWACASGARVAHGELLLFTDADTRHTEELLPRAVNALRARGAELFTITGDQEMHSFWERVIQPQMFGLLLVRYGGTETVSHTRRPADAIANGQYIIIRRDSYDAAGGHAAVRDRVAEDLSLAQNFVRDGRRLVMMLALGRFSTHMYASLDEIVKGWRKNIYAGGRDAALGGAAGKALFPIMLLSVPLIGLVPFAAFIFAAAGGLSSAWLLWSSVLVAGTLIYFAANHYMKAPVAYALLYPLGYIMFGYIALGAVVRGRQVQWKDRSYTSS